MSVADLGCVGLLWPPCFWHYEGLTVSLWLPERNVANPEIQPVHLWGHCKHSNCLDPCFFLNMIVFFSPSSVQYCFFSRSFKIFNAFAISRNTEFVCFLLFGTWLSLWLGRSHFPSRQRRRRCSQPPPLWAPGLFHCHTSKSNKHHHLRILMSQFNAVIFLCF